MKLNLFYSWKFHNFFISVPSQSQSDTQIALDLPVVLDEPGRLLLPLGDIWGISRACNGVEADVGLPVRVVIGEVKDGLRAAESESRALVAARRVEVALQLEEVEARLEA